DEVSRGGRTVLFVSHNVEAILKLCTLGMVLDSGRIISAGKVTKILSSYLGTQLSSSNFVDLTTKQRAGIYRGTARLERIIALGEQRNWSFLFGERLVFDIWIDAKLPKDNVELGVGLFSTRGFEVASWTNTCSQKQLPLQPGRNMFSLEYENVELLPGQYSLGIGLRSDGGFEDYVPEAVSFEVVVNSASANINTQSFGGVIVPVVNVSKLEQTCDQQSQVSHANG